MAKTRYCRATGCIDVFLAGIVADYDAAGSGGDWVGMANLAMKNAGHDCCS
jgi:hypothetical protein